MTGRFGRPNATGRSSGKLSGRDKKLWGPPTGKSWTWHTAEMLRSDAWHALGIHARRLLDLLELDHASHAGRGNGALMATYDQLADFGISRRKIKDAIREAHRLGFIEVEYGGRWNMTNRPSLFRLTYYTDRDGNPPTNDWRRYSADGRKKQNRPTESGTTVVPPCGATKPAPTKPADQKTAGILGTPTDPVVPPGGTPSISPSDTPSTNTPTSKRCGGEGRQIWPTAHAEEDDKAALLEIPALLDRRQGRGT